MAHLFGYHLTIFKPLRGNGVCSIASLKQGVKLCSKANHLMPKCSCLRHLGLPAFLICHESKVTGTKSQGNTYLKKYSMLIESFFFLIGF